MGAFVLTIKIRLGSPGVWLAKGPLAAKFMFGIAGNVVLSLQRTLSRLNMLFQLFVSSLGNDWKAGTGIHQLCRQIQ